MSHLPQMLRRLPYVFYALAVLFFVWQLANQWATLSLAYQYGAHRREERVFRVRRPTRDDHAVNPERADRERVEQADAPYR